MGIGTSEIVVILLIAFLVVGPSNLPKVARGLAKAISFLKTKWQEFLAEADMADVVDELKKSNRDVKKSVRSMIVPAELESELREVKRETAASVSLLKDEAATQPKAVNKGDKHDSPHTTD